jgi:hypothetical protein
LLSGFCGVISLILCFACKFIAKWHTKKYLHIHRQNGNPHSSAVSSIETRRK